MSLRLMSMAAAVMAVVVSTAPAFADVVCTGDWNGAGSSTLTWGDKGLVKYTFADVDYSFVPRSGLTFWRYSHHPR